MRKGFGGRQRIVFWLAAVLIFLGNADLSPQDTAQKNLEEKSTKLIILPIFYYTPETKLTGGVGGIITFRSGESGVKSRPSSFYFAAIYTQLKQFQLELIPEIYLQNEEYFVAGKFLLQKFPNKFYGIGNATPDPETEEEKEAVNYTPRSFSLEISALRKLFPNRKIYVGLKYQFENYKLLKIGRLLSESDAVGSRGGTMSGLGFLIHWDTRDNIFSPLSGNYWQFQTVINGSYAGSDYHYTFVKADLRKYFPLFSGHVLAIQGMGQWVTGDNAPFHKLAKLGGQDIMRGYYSGRYRDKMMVALQAEYRLPVWRWFGAVGFAGLGDVADKFGNLRLGDFKYSVGAGLRFMLDKKDRTQLRFDFGWGKGTSGMYFTAGEAF